MPFRFDHASRAARAGSEELQRDVQWKEPKSALLRREIRIICAAVRVPCAWTSGRTGLAQGGARQSGEGVPSACTFRINRASIQIAFLLAENVYIQRRFLYSPPSANLNAGN